MIVCNYVVFAYSDIRCIQYHDIGSLLLAIDSETRFSARNKDQKLVGCCFF